MSRTDREVRVKTRPALDMALVRARRIVVEGDPELADYAASRIGAEPPAPTAPGACPRVSEEDRRAHVRGLGADMLMWPWLSGAALLIVGAGAALVLERFSRVTATLGRNLAAPDAAQPPPPAVDPGVMALAALVIAAIAACFYVLHRATTAEAHGRGAWRVAERSGARLVLTRARVDGR